jgi:hypothetical protein
MMARPWPDATFGRSPWNRGRRGEEAQVSVTAEVVVENGGAPEDRVPEAGSSLDLLVVRLSAQYGVEPQSIRRHVAEGLAFFAGARVQAFVPILVEKRVRAMLRGWTDPRRIVAAHEESAAVAG